MFAVMPLPVFHDHTAVFRPASPSPLSSSPIRAASPPLAPRDPNALPRRDTKSSPIRGPNFRFSSRPSRPSRPVPIVQKREAAQEARRKLFLKNVRQRADDKAWERRGGDQELLKLEWWSLNREFQQSREADVEGIVSEAEIEDAVQLEQQNLETPLSQRDTDEIMVDEIAQHEEAELDALIMSQSQEPPLGYPQRPDSLHLSDDEDYDALFMELLSQDAECRGMSSDDVVMS